MNRIKDPEEYQVSERDLSISENSRKMLYKEAAKLLIKYNKLMEGEYEEEELKRLLNETLIIPGDAPTLFELYAVFKILRSLEDDFTLLKYEEGSSEIALFEKDETRVLVYHDSTGGMTFYEKLLDLRKKKANIEYLERFRKSTLKYNDLIKKLLDVDRSSVYGGRPDILIEHYEKDELKKLVIGEVKYSDTESTFKKGLKELVDYLYFAREGEKYSLGNIDIEGILIVDKKEFVSDDKLIDNRLMEVDGFDLMVYDTKNLQKIK